MVGSFTLQNSNSTISISDCYCRSYIAGLNRIGNSFGEFFEWVNASTSVSISQVYFENSFNPTISSVGSKYMPSINFITGFPCNQLYDHIISNYDQSLWGGSRLKSEFNYQFGGNFCPSSASCFYNVTNCVFCPLYPTQVDTNLFNISCEYRTSNQEWVWVFSPRNNGTIVNQNQIVVNGSTIFNGNFTQTSNGSLLINSNSTLTVSGCVVLDGKVTLVLDNVPVQSQSSYNLINYTCDQNADISGSQFEILTKDPKKDCEKISSQTIDSGNSISVSINFSVLGLAIGLGIGLPILLGVGFILIIYYLRKKQKRDTSSHLKKYEKELENYQSTTKKNDDL